MEDAAAAVSVLPDDVLPGILRRLPARSLVASRRVCKAWHTIIDEQKLLLRLRQLLPHSVGGIFINYIDHYKQSRTSSPGQHPCLAHGSTASSASSSARSRGDGTGSKTTATASSSAVPTISVETTYGVYFSESADKRTTEWLLKHQSALDPHAWWRNTRGQNDPQQRTYAGLWIMDVCDDRRRNKDSYDDYEYKEEWDSDDDNILDEEEEEKEENYFEFVKFLGFHPYKEVIFLDGSCITVAFHFNNAKEQGSGEKVFESLMPVLRFILVHPVTMVWPPTFPKWSGGCDLVPE
ncbi:hypothetical protein PR202_ga22681 [Eleusine coracana subsp. coracana]|uniref:F-box domain-containing protein n=1 Tax=Eleusine coracana subsp. coracana TaxID=191504 RepID=A0AAV5D4S7_ELECO|nr:hypothetical protein PR202_ga22681 [Eleusine coracana subsp. coracana]